MMPGMVLSTDPGFDATAPLGFSSMYSFVVAFYDID